DEIDNIERAMMEKFHILTTIHMDPIDIHDTLTNELRDKMTSIVESIDSLDYCKYCYERGEFIHKVSLREYQRVWGRDLP
ncbi:MAG: zinc ribbon domain-containing protein, partial [Helicobacter sp.]